MNTAGGAGKTGIFNGVKNWFFGKPKNEEASKGEDPQATPKKQAKEPEAVTSGKLRDHQ